jgi:hypothetical protein
MTTRKGGKKFPVYDLVLTLEWEGRMTGTEATVRLVSHCLWQSLHMHVQSGRN